VSCSARIADAERVKQFKQGKVVANPRYVLVAENDAEPVGPPGPFKIRVELDQHGDIVEACTMGADGRQLVQSFVQPRIRADGGEIVDRHMNGGHAVCESLFDVVARKA